MPGAWRGRRMAEPALPRLLYVADVPVESSQHGSALMYRVLDRYPADRLRIVETGVSSQPQRRLPGVAYDHHEIGRRRVINSRVHGLYSAWLTERAGADGRGLARRLADQKPDSVMTVGHGFGWRAAAAAAARWQVPLQFVVHDDWPRLSAIPGVLRAWLDAEFGRAYRQASNRLCVSPGMAEAYERRYGAAGTVMYPSRSSGCPVFPPLPPRPLGDRDELVLGYGGNSGAETMSGLLLLAQALRNQRARVEVFGAFDDRAQRAILEISPAFRFNGFVPSDRMIRELRDRADVLFVPMAFDEQARSNMILSFPSKLADYTASGLPLLIHGPSDCSAARWVRTRGEVAQLVETPGAGLLGDAIELLRATPARRWQLAQGAAAAGQDCFGPEAARQVLYAALASPPIQRRP